MSTILCMMEMIGDGWVMGMDVVSIGTGTRIMASSLASSLATSYKQVGKLIGG